MAPKPLGTTLVTGASGYLGSWIVAKLLERGTTVRASVRNPDDDSKTAHLRQLAASLPGTLEFVRLDLLEPESIDAAVAGCEVVVHSASPFIVGKVKDPQSQLVTPALEGTRNVLEAVNRHESVRRVVLTSSVVAIYGDACEAEQYASRQFNESHWNETSSLKHQPYSYAKTVAERLAWAMHGEQQRWSLAVLNPGFIFGPALSPRGDGASVTFMRELIGGKMKAGAPPIWFACVDVRTVAEAHARAAEREEVDGRNILVSQSLPLISLADELRKGMPDLGTLPTQLVPKSLFYLVAPFLGYSWKYVSRNVGHSFEFDNSRSRKTLGIEYPPLRETLIDHARQLIADTLGQMTDPNQTKSPNP